MGFPYYSHRELLRETKAGRWCSMGIGGFCNSVFGDVKFNLQKNWPAGGPEHDAA